MTPSVTPFPYTTRPWFCSGSALHPPSLYLEEAWPPPPARDLGLIGQRDIPFHPAPSRGSFRNGHVAKFRLIKYERKYVGEQSRKSFLFSKRKPQGRETNLSFSRYCSALMSCLGTTAAICYLTDEESQHWGIRAEMGRTWVLGHCWALLSLDFLLRKFVCLFLSLSITV